MKLIMLIKSNLMKQMRSRFFLLVLLASIFLGWLCVPAAADGYEIFDIGGFRGVYNSAWLGTVAAILSTILLWLPGFYLLRSQISEDYRLKIGEIIAAAPVTKLQYIFSKVLSNFIILCLLELLFLASFMVMQLIRGENFNISLFDYIEPFMFVTVSYLFVLAALTVLFDVIFVLKGSFGNGLIFVFWVTMTSFSVAFPSNPFDLFAIGKLLNAMTDKARSIFPSIPSRSGSFGFYLHTDPTPTFLWDGMKWDSAFLFSRLIWIIVTAAICVLASIVFDRFRKNCSEKLPKKGVANLTKPIKRTISFQTLPSVSHTHIVPVFSLLKGEVRILSTGLSNWWFMLFLVVCVLSWSFPLEQIKWGSFILLLPIPFWSQIGCDKKQYFTKELLISSGHQRAKWWASWFVGIFVAVLLSAGIIVRYLAAGEYSHCLAWFVGTVFIPTLSLSLGSLSETRRLFEAVFIVWFYLGCINNMDLLDFLGISRINTLFYLILTAFLLFTSRYFAVLREKSCWKANCFMLFSCISDWLIKIAL